MNNTTDKLPDKGSIETRSYAPYTYDHVENTIVKLEDKLRDVAYSGLTKTSKSILLRDALDSVRFLEKLMADSKASIGHVEFISYCDDCDDGDDVEECPGDAMEKSSNKPTYVTRLNEKLTTKQINKVLDAVDRNDGHCPCQDEHTQDTLCHCADYRNNKGIGEPCICKIYVKQEPK